MDVVTFNRLLEIGVSKGVSDIHFEVGYPPLFRARGHLIRSKLPNLTDEDLKFIATTILEQQHQKLDSERPEVDCSYSVTDVARFRATIFRQLNHFGVIMRVIPFRISSFEDLNLPKVMEKISHSQSGLILVTGPTGNGKSTTLASIVRYMNETFQYHIITLEDPVEFLFPAGNSCIVQREIRTDTPDFHTALKAAMRMDPDVILVGEMRDLETIDSCVKAAETGHLVLSSLHTKNSVATINRILSYFDASAQEVIRQRLADILVAIISLRLLKAAADEVLIPAVEIMRSTPAIAACIREGRLQEIQKHMENGRADFQMQTFDQHLVDMCNKKIITLEEALKASTSTDLERNLMFAG